MSATREAAMEAALKNAKELYEDAAATTVFEYTLVVPNIESKKV